MAEKSTSEQIREMAIAAVARLADADCAEFLCEADRQEAVEIIEQSFLELLAKHIPPKH